MVNIGFASFIGEILDRLAQIGPELLVFLRIVRERGLHALTHAADQWSHLNDELGRNGVVQLQLLSTGFLLCELSLGLAQQSDELLLGEFFEIQGHGIQEKGVVGNHWNFTCPPAPLQEALSYCQQCSELP